MGTTGYKYAGMMKFEPGEIILEIGSGDSTQYLAQLGPTVHTIDPVNRIWPHPNGVQYSRGRAEDVLPGWMHYPPRIGFAWLDGHDWPYTGNPPEYYAGQRAQYEARRQTYSQEASRASHLFVAMVIADWARVVAFDDTWRTHPWEPGYDGIGCGCPVPPATAPAGALSMDQALGWDTCNLPDTHPHHDRPEVGWNGKGGDAIPYLLEHGYRVLEYGLGLVIVERHTTT